MMMTEKRSDALKILLAIVFAFFSVLFATAEKTPRKIFLGATRRPIGYFHGNLCRFHRRRSEHDHFELERSLQRHLDFEESGSGIRTTNDWFSRFDVLDGCAVNILEWRGKACRLYDDTTVRSA